jgi:hypothetical protein
VDVFDVRNHERALVLARDWVVDIYRLVQLLKNSVISERAGSTRNEITSHSMLTALSLTREAFTCT